MSTDARIAGSDYARARWAGRAPNGKGRLWAAGGALLATTLLGIDDVLAFRVAAQETWDDLRTAPSATAAGSAPRCQAKA